MDEVTDRDLKILAQIDADCQALHLMPPVKTFLTWEVRNPDGSLELRHHRLSRTWTRNAYNYLCMTVMGIPMSAGGASYGAGKIPMKDTGGTTRTSATEIFYPHGDVPAAFIGTAGLVTKGIIVGTGTGAEDFEGHVLGTPIAHGTGAGQLSYGAQSNAIVMYDAGTKVLTAVHSRYMDNGSGGTIAVAETAWYVQLSQSGNPYYFMLTRDLLGSAVDVLATQRLTVSYTMTMTFPA
jgi:hypothetical protein